MANAQPVFLHMASGDVLRMDPDYIAQCNGTYYLYVDSYYDVHTYDQNWIILSQCFLNNHCLSKNFQTGVWSITRKMNDTAVAPVILDDNESSESV